MALDTLNSRILITGSFYHDLILPDTTLTGTGLTVFLLVMDLDKHVLWARAAGGNSEDIGYGIACDLQGNIYISGINGKDATFQQTTVPRGGFLAKYDKDGNLLWAKNKFRYMALTSYFTEAAPWNLSFQNEHLIVAGDAVHSTIVVDTVTLTLPMGHNAVFFGSFSPQGDAEWLRAAGSPDGSGGIQVLSCDRTGNIYLSGIMWGSKGIFGNDTLYSTYADCFLAKYSSNGTYQWARGIQPSLWARGLGVAADNENNVYFTGNFMGYGHFGPYVLFSDATSMDTMNIFIARYTGDGECLGARQYSKGASIVAVDPDGQVLHGGSFLSTINIGPQPLTSRGNRDVFLAKCSPITGIVQPKETETTTLLVYANPSTGQCRITIPDEFRTEKELTLTIYDQTGRLVQESSVNISGETVTLDIRAQAKGLYHAILSNGKKSYSGKIVFD